MINFFLTMKPPTKTHQQKSATICADGKIRFYEDEKLKDTRAKFIAYLNPFKPDKALDGPIRLIVKWLYPKSKKYKNGEYKITKPDLGNAQKLLQDCMTKVGFWNDDSQIASLICEKFWADIPGIYIKVEKIKLESEN